MKRARILIIGGGAAGFFAAIRAAECAPEARITILERGRNVLGKVKVSGGGRCNVTHACFEPGALVRHYPRGARELLGPFHRFSTGDTVDWFESRGIPLKAEADGRMFPVTDRSETIVNCLWENAANRGVEIRTTERVEQIRAPRSSGGPWLVHTAKAQYEAERVLVATGGSPSVWKILKELGHTIVPPVPSLFTFNLSEDRLTRLAGIAMPHASVKVDDSGLRAEGPLLITHWGLSGPAILRLSAWGARELHQRDYRFFVSINWPGQNEEELREELEQLKIRWAKKQVISNSCFGIPQRLWRYLVRKAGIGAPTRWASLKKGELQQLLRVLTRDSFPVQGKSTFKEEFVTAGGVALEEVNFKTFESKKFPGLFFAGEVLDIDAITGGFNFQAAWTGGWIAGEALTH